MRGDQMTKEQRERLNSHIMWLEQPEWVDKAIGIAQDIDNAGRIVAGLQM